MQDEELKFTVLKNIGRPVVFSNKLERFECANWSLEDWASKCADIRLPFRLVKIDDNAVSSYSQNQGTTSNNSPQWEGNASYVHATVSEFLHWLEQNSEAKTNDNPLSPFSNKEYWCYSSYNHMKESFKDKDDILQAVDWHDFGFSKTGKESTLWIGTKGAYTPCHMDSYGCNLVAQLIGRKLWVLFPPEDGANLYPTRIPYEESSVFSSVNIPSPDFKAHAKFANCHPHVVMLKPGDVLFVPRHWWHFVQCQDTSVSVNMWIEQEEDKTSQLHEAIVKVLMTAFVSTYEPDDGEMWLNPTEDLIEPVTAESYLKMALERLLSNQAASSEDAGGGSSEAKRMKLDPMNQSQELNGATEVPSIDLRDLSHFFPHFPLTEIAPETKKSPSPSAIQATPMSHLLNCFTHDDVVSVIAEKLKDMFT